MLPGEMERRTKNNASISSWFTQKIQEGLVNKVGCFAVWSLVPPNCSQRHQHHTNAEPPGAEGRPQPVHEPGRVGAAPRAVRLQVLQPGQRRLLRRDEVPCELFDNQFILFNPIPLISLQKDRA